MARCRTVRSLFNGQLQIGASASGWELDDLLCMRRNTSDEDGVVTIRQMTLGIYALYRTHNLVRTRVIEPGEITGVFGTYLREGRRNFKQ